MTYLYSDALNKLLKQRFSYILRMDFFCKKIRRFVVTKFFIFSSLLLVLIVLLVIVLFMPGFKMKPRHVDESSSMRQNSYCFHTGFELTLQSCMVKYSCKISALVLPKCAPRLGLGIRKCLNFACYGLLENAFSNVH